MLLRLALASLLLVLLAACGGEDEPPPADPAFEPEGILEFLRPDGSRITAIAVEIAEGDSAQVRGLMQRRSLPARGGMIFPYEEAASRTFWMRNTYLPLDIIFVGSDGEVVNIHRGARPLSDERITSSGPANLVVEVRSGFADRHGLTDSTRVRWTRRDDLP